MGTATTLRQLPRSLCQNTQWKYAVLWKLQHENRMQLTLEVGYFDNLKPAGAVENTLHCNEKPGITLFEPDMDTQSGQFSGCPVEYTVGGMRCSYREGLLHQVASTRKHHWVFSSDHPKSLAECSDEWKLQFEAGIKTILLVPVLTHGALQLGSLDEVTEDPNVVAYIKDLFRTLQQDTGACNSLAPRFNCLYPLAQFIPVTECVSTSAIPGGLLIPVQSQQLAKKDLKAFHFCKVIENESEDPRLFPFSLDQDDCPEPCQGEIIEEDIYKGILLSLTNEHCYLEQPAYSEKMIEDESKFTSQASDITYRPKPKLSTMPGSCKQDEKHVGFSPHITKVADQSFRDVSYIEANCVKNGRFLKFPANSELHKALGLGSWKEHDDFAWVNSPLKADGLSSSNAFCKIQEPEENVDSTEPAAWFMNDKETEGLLDAVVAKAPSSDNASKICGCISKCSSNLSGWFQDSCMTESNTESNILGSDESVPKSPEGSDFVTRRDGLTNFSTGALSKSISMSINAEPMKGTACTRHRRGCKSSSFTKQRYRNNVRKPRPRDRQLIQDRVKELRQLIPDGSKCSIDALLGRTVKHMFFLQSVSSGAEKLRQCAHLEVKERT